MQLTCTHLITPPDKDMYTLQAEKITAADWHRADIVAALHKQGWSLRKLSKKAGLSAGALSNALDRPWPKAERIIAATIGQPPEIIWPSRYSKRNSNPVLSPLAAALVNAAALTAVA